MGRLHLVRPNQSSPYYPELAGLLRKAVGPVTILAELLEGVNGVEGAYLFGSRTARWVTSFASTPRSGRSGWTQTADPSRARSTGPIRTDGEVYGRPLRDQHLPQYLPNVVQLLR